MRNALLAAWSADDLRIGAWPHVTDAQLRVTRLLSGEPVSFFGSDLPDDIAAHLRLRSHGYYTVDGHDRVRTRTEYP